MLPINQATHSFPKNLTQSFPKNLTQVPGDPPQFGRCSGYGPQDMSVVDTGVDPTAGTSTAGIGGVGDPLPACLTAEGLLLFCKTKLDSLDNEIDGLMDEQLKALDRKKAISNVENKMKEFNPPASGESWTAIKNAFDEAIKSLPENDPTRLALIARRDEIFARYSNSGIGRGPTKDEWAAHMGDMHQELENVKGDSELGMIRLQSAVSQRQTAVQLTTNIMSKFYQTMQSVTNNLKG